MLGVTEVGQSEAVSRVLGYFSNACFLYCLCWFVHHDISSFHHMFLPPWCEMLHQCLPCEGGPEASEIMSENKSVLLQVLSVRYCDHNDLKVTKTQGRTLKYF